MKTMNLKAANNNVERMLLVMPKKCGCPICKATREKAKKELGEVKYYKLVKKLGMVS